jgi:membrane protease subunit HflK
MRARHHRPSSPLRPHAHGHPHRGRSWGRWLAALLPAALVAWVATGFYSVGHNERAIVRRGGRVLPEVRDSGLHFGLPYGIDRVTRLKVFETRRVAVGMALGERALGRRIDPQQAETLTGDRNLIAVSAVVHYAIRYDPADPQAAEKLAAYLFRVADVPALVRNKAAAALTAVITTMPVDDVITTGRQTIREQVRRRVQADLDRHGVAVDVTDVLLEELSPPQEVADAFRDVITARADQDRTINEAKGYRNRVVPQARGEAQRMRTEADAFAMEIVEKARGDARRFEQIAAEAAHNRQLTARRLLLETAEQVLPRLRKIVVGDKAARGLDLGIIEPEE